MREADVVLGVVGAGLSEACRQELNASMTIPKQAIVMADPLMVPELQPYFPNLVVINAANPDQTELGIVQHLRDIDAGQQVKKALIALGTLALGLLIFAAQD